MNGFGHLKIGQRLYLGFAVVLALLCAITALAWSGLNASQGATERIVEMKELAANAEESLMGTQLNINRVLAVAKSGNNPAVDSYFKPLIANTTARNNEIQKELEDAITSERGKALLAEAADKRSAYIAVRKTYFDTVTAGDTAGADQILNTGLMPAADVYSGKLKELLDFQNGLVTKAVEASEATTKSQIALLTGLAAAAIALAMVMAWRITRSVTQPLAEAVAMSRDVAAGDLTCQIKTSRGDESGDLLRSLAEMQSSLVNTVTQVRSATDSINTASAEIASGNQDLSARTEQAASNLEETAASMEQLTSTVRQSADSARQANQLAASASQIAVRGARWQRGRPSGYHHERNQRQQQKDQRHHRCDRWHCVPDQHLGAQRGC